MGKPIPGIEDDFGLSDILGFRAPMAFPKEL